tara:strand:+ start:1499 stop:2125 length:627 start_codon:yes stop_codon:yes gene_type:complete
MSKEIILYDYPLSSAAYRVRIALNLKGIRYKKVLINLLHQEQQSDLYLAKNPQGLIPSLSVDGQVITQSIAIIEWLDETYTQQPLLPQGALEKAHLRAQAYTIACDIHPLNNLRVLRYLVDDMAHNETEKMAWYYHWIKLAFTSIEAYIDANAQNNQANLLDTFLVPQVFNANRFKLDMTPYPSINQRVIWCNQQSAFQQAHPDTQRT